MITSDASFLCGPEPNGESCIGSLIMFTSGNLRSREVLLSARLFAENAAPGFQCDPFHFSHLRMALAMHTKDIDAI